MNLRTSRRSVLWFLVGLGISNTAVADSVKTVRVDCARGETIAKALEHGDERKPLLVLVRGTCNEAVSVSGSDVTLRGETGFGGTINGPDPSVNTVTVTGSRVTIEDLEVTGGRNGVTAVGAAGLTVRNLAARSTGRTGVAFVHGASGTVDGSTIQSNPRDGVAVEAAQATIINSTISQNARAGVLVVNGAAARVGVTNTNVGAGNTISQNGLNGIAISISASAIIGTNQIANNGASGIGVTHASADIWGGNVISANTGQGIFARGASVQIGSPPPDFPTTVNTITGNGSAASAGGIFAFLGSAMLIRDAEIDANKGFGLGLSLRSSAQLVNSKIRDNVAAGPNPGDGIRLIFGSGLFVTAPNSTVSGNAGFGLQCTDGESSVVNTGLLTLSGNALGGVSGSCTGF